MRKNVIAIDCSRCGTTEYKEGSVLPNEVQEPALKITAAGKNICLHPDLCGNCTEVVIKLVAAINKPLEKKSPTRKKKVSEAEAANGTGPKPPAHPAPVVPTRPARG
jgi:hypothetical protein